MFDDASNKQKKQHLLYQKEIQYLQDKLEEEKILLQQQKPKFPKLRYEKLKKSYLNKAQSLQQLLQQRKRLLDQMYVSGMRKIKNELQRMVRDLAQKRGIDLVLNSASGQSIVIYSDTRTVITDVVRKRLNQLLPEVTLDVPKGKLTTGSDIGLNKNFKLKD